MKGLTVRDIDDKVVYFNEKMTSEKMYELSQDATPSFPIFIYDYFIENGRKKKKQYCATCGAIFDTDEYSYRQEPCPCCGAVGRQVIFGQEVIPDSKVFTHILSVDEENGTIYFSMLIPIFSLDPNVEKTDDFKWLKATPKVSTARKIATGAFSTNRGFRFYENDRVSPKSNKFFDLVERFRNSTIVNPEIAKNIFNTNAIIDAIMIANSDVEQKNEEKKRKKKNTIQAIDPYEQYKCEDVDDNIIFSAFDKSGLKVIKSSVGNKSTFLFACPHCKTLSTHEIIGHKFPSIKCPTCDATLTNTEEYASQRIQDSYCNMVVKYELMKGTNDLIIRIFEVAGYLSLDEGFRESYEEQMRIFISPKKMTPYLGNRHGDFLKGRASDLDKYVYRQKTALYQSEQSVIDIINQSSLKYSGLIDALGYGYRGEKVKVQSFMDYSRKSYIYVWTKNHRIELILKAGLVNVVKNIMKNEAYAVSLHDGTDVCQVLGISKPVLKLAIATNADASAMSVIKHLWETDNTLTLDVYNALAEVSSTPTDFCALKTQYGVSYAKAIEYLNGCYNYQCIEKKEALNIWRDYLRMAKDMTYRLDNKNTKYPSSLKKEHDKAMFAYRVVLDERNRQSFHKAAENNKKYAYSYDKLIAIIPQEPEEIVEEGTNQKHCVASYVNSVRDGYTTIVFIRKKEEPKTSYYTVEIRDNKVVQVRGYTNRSPQEKEVLEFLDKWAKAKNLELAYT